MNRARLAALLLSGTVLGLFSCTGTAHPASPASRARAALALAQAAAHVKAAAAGPVVTVEEPPARACPCSDRCSCGCVQGEPCRCPPAFRPPIPATVYPPVPVRRRGC